MSTGALPLLARLGEAASFPKVVRNYEDDPWGYMRRKLEECEEPLRSYKRKLYDEAAAKLLCELNESFLKPGSLLDHKETFEKLLAPADFADISFNLEPGVDPQTRREAIQAVLTHAKPRTLFDIEALPVERRGKIWEGLVEESGRRLELDKLRAIYERKPKTDFRRSSVTRRARKNLGDLLALMRDKSGMREDITLFMLIRLETAIAALRRFLVKAP